MALIQNNDAEKKLNRRERERERERERDRERERERETDRQTDRQTDRDRDRERGVKEKERERKKKSEKVEQFCAHFELQLVVREDSLTNLRSFKVFIKSASSLQLTSRDRATHLQCTTPRVFWCP